MSSHSASVYSFLGTPIKGAKNVNTRRQEWAPPEPKREANPKRMAVSGFFGTPVSDTSR